MTESDNRSSEIKKALEDIAYVRRSVDSPITQGSLRTEIIMTSSLVIVAIFFLLLELTGLLDITGQFLASAEDPALKLGGMIKLALTLVVLSFGVYFLAWKKARATESFLSATLKRNFPALQFDAFLPDLFLKFFILGLVILIPRPDLVALIFVAFVGDYAFQGKFFRLPRALSIIIGIVLYALAGLMYLNHSVQLSYALTSFVIVGFISIFNLYRLKNAGASSDDQAK